MTIAKPIWISKPTPNVWPGKRLQPIALVVHVMAGTLTACDSWFASPAAQASANFGIGKLGEIHCYVDPDGPDSPWANGIVQSPDAAFLALSAAASGVNSNWWTISIEHEGQSGDVLTPAQLDASAHVAAWCCERYGISPDRAHWLGHYQIDSVTRAHCPGWTPAQWAAWQTAVRGYLATPVPVPEPVQPGSALARIRSGQALRTKALALRVQADSLDQQADIDFQFAAADLEPGPEVPV